MKEPTYDLTAATVRLQEAKANGLEPERFCSFLCRLSDSNQAQYAACLAVNGIYCAIMQCVVLKGTPCKVRAVLSPAK